MQRTHAREKHRNFIDFSLFLGPKFDNKGSKRETFFRLAVRRGVRRNPGMPWGRILTKCLRIHAFYDRWAARGKLSLWVPFGYSTRLCLHRGCTPAASQPLCPFCEKKNNWFSYKSAFGALPLGSSTHAQHWWNIERVQKHICVKSSRICMNVLRW